jgi:hypothetical protein
MFGKKPKKIVIITSVQGLTTESQTSHFLMLTGKRLIPTELRESHAFNNIAYNK